MPAADTARLIASLELRDKDFLAGLGRVEKGIGRLGVKTTALGTGIGIGIERLAEKGISSAVSFIGNAITDASDLNETLSKTKVVFGDAAAEVLAFGKTSATQLGLSENAADSAAATFGNLFVSMGLVPKASAKMSTTLVTLAGDLASFNNVSPEDALEALRSGLVGETEPLRKFGINLNEQTLKSKALQLGLVKLAKGQKNYTAVLTPAQKAQAAYALILEQSQTAQGDFARTSGGLANQQRILAGQLQNVSAQIGTALLPQITKIVSKVNQLIQENGPAIQDFANSLPGAFDKAVAFAEKIPWGIIGEGLRTAAEWAGRLFDVFINLPPEVQTTLVALAGLNKLSGGAVTGIVGELGKGLIKGVLGMTAGVVNINAGVVNGGGVGVPGAAPAAAAGGLTAGAVATTAAVGVILVGGAAVSLNAIAEEAGKNNVLAAQGLTQQEIIAQKYYNANKADQDRIFKQLHGAIPPVSVFESGNAKLGQLNQATTQGFVRNAERQEAIRNAVTEAHASAITDSRSEQAAIGAVATQAAANQRQASIDAAGIRTGVDKIPTATEAVRAAVERTRAAASAAGQQTAAAIRDKDLSVTLRNYLTVNTSISVANDLNAKNNYKSVYKVAS